MVPAHAALDPETGKPYELHVILRVAEHRLLTPVFKEQVTRELRDSLQAAFGDFATVKVFHEHPKLKDIEENGLGQALDAWKDVSEFKTHFVFIDFTNGVYEIHARQHDGFTGQASPVLRRETTPDRQFVARTAALMINRDFGPVGTVTDKGDGVNVKITLKGSTLKVPLDRWIKEGEVFALVQIAKGGGGMKGNRVPWALLQVQQPIKDGVVECKLFHRHPRPLDGPGALGYRCVKLETIATPVRLRLVDASAKTTAPLANKQIVLRRQGFKEDAMPLQAVTDADGYYSTEKDKEKGTYNRVAFVSVVSDNKVHAQVPIALVDERTVVIPVTLGAEMGSQLTVRRDQWVTGVYEDLLILADVFKELEAIIAKGNQREAALAKAGEIAKQVQDDLLRFGEQRERLVKDAGSTKLDLSEGDQSLVQLRDGQQKLEKFRAGLEKIVKEQNDPARKELQAKVQQAQLLESEAEIQKALDLYDQVLKASPDDAELKKKVEALRESWKPKNERHAKARAYVYDTWPNVEATKLGGQLPAVKAALDVCKGVGDMVTPQKFLKATVAHAVKLKELLAALDPDRNDDDRNTAKAIAETTEELNKVVKDVNAYLAKGGK